MKIFLYLYIMIKMQKPKAWSKERNKDKAEAIRALDCQTIILEFLHFKEEFYWEVKPATERTVQEFWNYLENKKEELYKRGQHFEERPEYNSDRINEQKYNREKKENS